MRSSSFSVSAVEDQQGQSHLISGRASLPGFVGGGGARIDCRKFGGAGGIDSGDDARGGEPRKGCEFLLESI